MGGNTIVLLYVDMSHLAHPHILQSPTKLYLILDYIRGGELFTRLDLADHHELPDRDVIFYAAEMVCAIEHLHAMDIIYRDLKVSAHVRVWWGWDGMGWGGVLIDHVVCR